jgi:hypothetical protein
MFLSAIFWSHITGKERKVIINEELGIHGGTAGAASATTALKVAGKSASHQNDRNETSEFSPTKLIFFSLF